MNPPVGIARIRVLTTEEEQRKARLDELLATPAPTSLLRMPTIPDRVEAVLLPRRVRRAARRARPRPSPKRRAPRRK